ncbi:MAG TPA: DUF2779 domain-containing protein, partial [Oligoflexia bacterium]|nr:DUF2779 domain-containing protein [Oligoflexia bacterium]
LIEVKSSGSVKKEHLPDVAFQLYAAEEAGFRVSCASVMVVNKEFTRHSAVELFRLEDKTEEAQSLRRDIQQKVPALNMLLKEQNEPFVQIGSYCTADPGCEFKDYCWRNLPKDSVCTIPGLLWKKKEPLIERGIIDLRDIPADFSLNDRQRAYVKAVLSGKPQVDKKGIKEHLLALTYPIYFFDIETDACAIPRYDDIHPHQKFPFQFSCHILQEDGTIKHREFLHTEDSDPRPAFIDALLSTIGDTGSVVAYHASFEGSELTKLASASPEYAPRFQSIVGRLWDEEAIFLKHYTHPDFGGRTSIKVVLPVLVSGLSYKGLGIQDGDTASAAWNRMVTCRNPAKKERLAADLKEYCKLDTLAMVEIYRHLKQVI